MALPTRRTERYYKLRSLTVAAFATLTVFAAGCSKEDDFTDQQRLCIAREYPSYNPKHH
jgi:hypothetical protein